MSRSNEKNQRRIAKLLWLRDHQDDPKVKTTAPAFWANLLPHTQKRIVESGAWYPGKPEVTP